MLRSLLPALLAPCLLAACVNETAIPEASDAAAPRRAGSTAVPTPPSAPVTAFDGRYAGKVTLAPDRSRACPPAPAQDLALTVRQGRGTFEIDPANRRVLTGMVGPTGDVRMSDSLDRTIATTGIFDRGRFVGEHKVGRCTYTVSLTKRD